MLKKILSVFVFFLQLLLFVGCSKDNTFNKDDNLLLMAVPVNSSIVVEITNYKEIEKVLANSNIINEIKNSLFAITFKYKIQDQIAFVPEEFLDRGMVITSTPIGVKDYEFMLIMNKESAQDSIDFNTNIRQKHTPSLLNYDGINIFSFINDKKAYYYAFEKNTIVLSRNKLLIEQSIRQSNTVFSLYKDNNFQQVYRKIKSPKIACIFIKHDNINRYIPLLNGYFKTINFQNFSDWSAFDVVDLTKNIRLKGVTQPKDSLSSSVFVYKNIIPQKSTILDKVPNIFFEFENIRFERIQNYRSNFKKYINHTNIYNEIIRNKNLNFNLLEKYITNEIIILKTSERNENNDYLIFLAIKDKQLVSKNLLLSSTMENIYFKNYTIKEINQNHYLANFFGRKDLDFPQTYYLVTDGLVVFSNSVNGLKSYIISIIMKNVLSEDKPFLTFLEQYPTESNYVYVSKKNAADFAQQKDIKPQSDLLIGLSICVNDLGQFDQQFHIEKNINNTNGQQLIGNINLETPVVTQPKLFYNFDTKVAQTAFQTQTNTIHCLNTLGQSMWYKSINQAVMTNFEVIDLFGNGRNQLLFGTTNKIYLIDRNGKELTPFPIPTNQNMTQPFGVFDYNVDYNYRILTVQNSHLELYDKNGNKVEDFKYKPQVGIITSTPQHVKINNVDLILFTQNYNRLTAIDKTGKLLWNQDFDTNILTFGKMNDFIEIITKDAKRYQTDELARKKEVETIDLNDDSKLQITNKSILVYNKKQIEIITNSEHNTYQHPTNTIENAKIFQFGYKSYTVFNDAGSDKVYLLDKDARLIKGFPLIGGSNNCLMKLINNQLILISTDKNGMIYHYRIN